MCCDMGLLVRWSELETKVAAIAPALPVMAVTHE
jgi:hypothetical protein